MPSNFANQRIWITGASSGIGEALAKAFHASGAKLVLTARRESELARVQAACGGEAVTRTLPADLTQASQLAQTARAAEAVFSGLDMVVHNAGISQRSLVKDTDPSVDRRIMELNFFAPVILTKALLPEMLERGSGHIVVISSLVGKFGTPLRSAYAASKHALHGFFDSMRAEVGRNGIKVTIVCPGYIRTQVSLHALVGSGAEHGKTDASIANGMDPDQCAAQILRKLAKGKKEIYVAAGREKYAVYLKRFTPGLFDRLVARLG